MLSVSLLRAALLLLVFAALSGVADGKKKKGKKAAAVPTWKQQDFREALGVRKVSKSLTKVTLQREPKICAPIYDLSLSWSAGGLHGRPEWQSAASFCSSSCLPKLFRTDR
jgi:hypothetical protein